MKHGDPKQLLNALANENRIAIGNFTFTDTPLQLGHLKVRFQAPFSNLFSINLMVVLFIGQSFPFGSQKCSG